MSIEIAVDTPLAQALTQAIQPKLVEVGWSAGGTEGELAEYIILMLVNGKTQEQVAAELSNELLGLDENDPGAREFAQWLFNQVQILGNPQAGAGAGQSSGAGVAQEQSGSGGDAEMGDAPGSGDANVPTGPKSMRNIGGNNRTRDKRMLGQLTKAMDRTGDSVLHRVRQQSGNERINSHSRGGLPTGPRQSGPNRGALRQQNGRPNPGFNGMPIPGPSAAANVMNMNPQQQLELYAMLEQQSRLMAQMLGQKPQSGFGGAGPQNFGNGVGGFQQPQQGRSLFERAQPNPQRQAPSHFNKPAQNGRFNNQKQSEEQAPSSSLDVEMSQENKPETEETICRFNLRCTNPECPYAHQSPAAPPGITIDVKDVCSFGAACKNFKCVARHPSPAKKSAHQADTDCKFFPNCTNSNCPFRHPAKAKPLCRNGPNCSTPNCPFTHTTNVTTMCMFNPCTKPTCPYKHAEGQQRPYEDKVWVAGGSKPHVSERKFVDESAPEELIKPEVPESKEPAATDIIA